MGIPATLDSRFCTSCGRPAAGGKFCGNCGAASDAPPADPTVQIPRVPSQPVPELTAPAPAPAPAPATAPVLAPAVSPPLADLRPTLVFDRAEPGEGLGGLTWQDPADDLDALDVAPARRGLPLSRRQGLIGAITLVVVAALVVAGVLGNSYLADGDLRQALTASSRAFNSTVEAFSAATNAEQVAAAAGQTGPAVDRVDRALTTLGTVTVSEDRAVRSELEAEKGVLVALGGLEGLASKPLASWGNAHSDLTGAIRAETTARTTLARFRGDHTRNLADTALMLKKVTAAVGPALVEDATAESARLLQTLSDAKSTADLRTLGDAAAAEQSAVAAAANALPDGDGKQVLSGYASALNALGGLARISGESASGWTSTRAELAQTFGQVAAAAGSTGGSSVRVALDGSLDAADKVVAAAAAAIADWKAKTEAAIKARIADGEALRSYASFFRTQTKTYEQLRQDLSAFTKRVEEVGVSYEEGFFFMSQAEQDRRDVRDVLISTDVPQGMDEAHQGVVSAIDRAIGAVQSAYDGLSQSQDCFEGCPYYQDTPGWQRFLSESDGISMAYTAAIKRWEPEVAATSAQITNRSLPAKPNV